MFTFSQFFAWYGLLCAIGFAFTCILFGPATYRYLRDDTECRAYLAASFWRLIYWLSTPIRWAARGLTAWWVKRGGSVGGLLLVILIVVGLWVGLIALG